MNPKTLEALEESARNLAKSVSYLSAGTVEFLYDEDGDSFFFLEVNTRLQVEHGVTELVHGIDLVEWMIQLSRGDSSMFDKAIPSERTCRTSTDLCRKSCPEFRTLQWTDLQSQVSRRCPT